MTPRLPDCRPRIRPKTERNVALTVPAGQTRPGKPRAKNELKLSRPRIATSPRRLGKERRRIVAAVRPGTGFPTPGARRLARCTGAAGGGLKLPGLQGLFWGQRR